MVRLSQRALSPSDCHVDRCHVDSLIRFFLIVFVACGVSFLLPVNGRAVAADSNYLESPIKEENRHDLILMSDGLPIGEIVGYSHYSGLVISMRQLFDILGYEYTYDKTEKRIFGKDKNSRWFMIKTAVRTLTLGTKEYKYSPQDAYHTEDDIYAEISFLSQYFDFDLSVNLNTLNLFISTKSSPVYPDVPDEAATVAPPPPAPTPAPAPTEPPAELPVPAPASSPEEQQSVNVEEVKILSPDQLSQELKEDGSETSQEEAAVPKEYVSPPEPVVFKEEYLMSFELEISKLKYEDLVDVYGEGEYYYFSLSQLFKAIEFPIKVDGAAGTADGWFIKSENTFKLDMNAKTVEIAGKQEPLGASEAFIYDGEIFVFTDLANKWFPLGISLKFQSQTLALNPAFLLPFQAKKERDKKHEDWARKKDKTKVFDTLKNEYGFTKVPMADFNWRTGYNKTADTEGEFEHSFSTIVSGDINPLNVQSYASGTEEELSALRVIGSRKEDDGSLPGGLTNIQVGDVNSVETPLVGGSNQGRGVYLSSAPLDAPTQFDSTTIEGDNLPGWEIELYNNGTLIDFQVVGNDGRYKFENVPILFGNNDIKLVFYGPQGEVREENRSYVIGDSLLSKGNFLYSFSANEENSSLFRVGNTESIKGRTNITGDIKYGLTDSVTMVANTTHAQLDSGDEHTYQSLGLATSLGKVLASITGVQDLSAGGWAAQMLANTSIADVTVQGKQILYSHDYVSKINDDESEDIQSISSLGFSGNVEIPVVSGLRYGLDTVHTRYQTRHHETEFTGRLGTSFRGVSISNTTTATFDKTLTDSNMTIDGDMALRGRAYDTTIRADFNYDVEPITQLRNVVLSGQRKISDEWNAKLDIDKSFLDERIIRFSGLINWDNGSYMLGNEISFDNNESFSIVANLSFSLMRDERNSDWIMQSKPLADNGGVSAIAFLDSNYNNIRDEGEEVLKDVTFLRNNIKHKSAENGSALITRVPSFSKTNLSVDTLTLEDELMVPRVEGYSVIARAGVVQQIDFPIIQTSEIDGTVYFIKEDGSEETVSGLTLFLVTPEGKKVGQTKTEFDGLYIFSKVLPGDYLVVVSDEEMAMLSVKPFSVSQVKVELGSDIYSGYDIILNKFTRTEMADNQAAEKKAGEGQLAEAEIPETQETPWPEETQVTSRETPILPDTAQAASAVPQQTQEDILTKAAAKTALLPKDVAFWPDIYSLPESRYSEAQLGLYAHLKSKSLDEIQERIAERQRNMDMYSSPIGRFSGNQAIFASLTQGRGFIWDKEQLEARYNDYISAIPSHSMINRLGALTPFIDEKVRSIGTEGDTHSTKYPSPPSQFTDPIKDIQDRLNARKPWMGLNNSDTLTPAKSPPDYKDETSDSGNSGISAALSDQALDELIESRTRALRTYAPESIQNYRD